MIKYNAVGDINSPFAGPGWNDLNIALKPIFAKGKCKVIVDLAQKEGKHAASA